MPEEEKKDLKGGKMLIVGILSLIVLVFIAINMVCSLDLLIRIAADLSSIQDYCSREHAKTVAEDMKKKGYILTEAGKELLKANTGRG